MKNLSPNLIRQRVIIEAVTRDFINDTSKISQFLLDLSRITKMTVMQSPIVYTAHEDGYGSWIHWKTSGAVFYTYPGKENERPNLITLDCYTCKSFSVLEVVEFVRSYFNVLELEHMEVGFHE
jgi:S-adenosylmethionine/arginine decarboxylase-like enzyme